MVASKRTFLIQVQPELLSFMTESDVLQIAAKLDRHWPERVTVSSGDDDGRYVNIRIDSDDAISDWRQLQPSFVSSKLPGSELRAASIITVTGDRGWDDYLLLHHFDDTEPLDLLPNGG